MTSANLMKLQELHASIVRAVRLPVTPETIQRHPRSSAFSKTETSILSIRTDTKFRRIGCVKTGLSASAGRWLTRQKLQLHRNCSGMAAWLVSDAGPGLVTSRRVTFTGLALLVLGSSFTQGTSTAKNNGRHLLARTASKCVRHPCVQPGCPCGSPRSRQAGCGPKDVTNPAFLLLRHPDDAWLKSPVPAGGRRYHRREFARRTGDIPAVTRQQLQLFAVALGDGLPPEFQQLSATAITPSSARGPRIISSQVSSSRHWPTT